MLTEAQRDAYAIRPVEGTMTVRVRDRASEAPWGSGLNRPAIRTVTIPRACPRCGCPRGEARNLNQHDDGEWYSVDIWQNPCGHVDHYADVVREAARLADA